MNKLVKDALKRIYIDKDYEYFKNKCNTEIQLSKELLKKQKNILKMQTKKIQKSFLLKDGILNMKNTKVINLKYHIDQYQ